ncbi:response regulator [Aestuariivirga litoralis]|uniref:response regulator n=1 Tax=Aestuariivirga litoralis TaxID=2650924 RepID=UPI0018C609D9|nr:response regulator [Aestuariivirga litoralis]MBG1233880.1 response regulator [Aestuariivirga litoralis]
MRVLLVEDDVMIGQGLRVALQDEGMAVDWVRSGADAMPAIQSAEYGIVLLDLNLPETSGLDVLKDLRQRSGDEPVLIISARDTIDDRLSGLDLGADDYLVKPFDTRELISRMRALVRRKAGHAVSDLSNGEITLNLATHEVTHGGQSAVLPAKAFALLAALMQNPGHIWSRAKLEESVYGWNEEVESNAIEVLIHSIRKRFSKDVILNVRGAGWKVREKNVK